MLRTASLKSGAAEIFQRAVCRDVNVLLRLRRWLAVFLYATYDGE